MIRKIIEIDEAACTGCGLCVTACHEGAIGLVGGKARLLRDDYCDGLGDCLPACPTGAIAFVEREAEAYDEAAVLAAQGRAEADDAEAVAPVAPRPSELASWPVEIKLVPVQAPYFQGAHVLIAADCTAFAYADFHRDFMRGRITLIGCPKLDAVDYSQKLEAVFAGNDIASVTVARMEVPCCGGLEHAARTALERSGKDVPFEVAVISTRGDLLERR
ncbi:4Fe-4S binding protein [Eggerthella guodeyinii]|uniref:4Fe-4S binding protein n=1 Tax=Eggerthella guodeyinii TaxID=2690837 RepID=A0A6L7ISK2_9ACTN|nr:4Fe-4S dicluster domain-containing protein [Eggerthella guodeyinii]QOS66709.1 4Fe-4S binding protein [Eggerthella guodeyinii]